MVVYYARGCLALSIAEDLSRSSHGFCCHFRLLIPWPLLWVLLPWLVPYSGIKPHNDIMHRLQKASCSWCNIITCLCFYRSCLWYICQNLQGEWNGNKHYTVLCNTCSNKLVPFLTTYFSGMQPTRPRCQRIHRVRRARYSVMTSAWLPQTVSSRSEPGCRAPLTTFMATMLENHACFCDWITWEPINYDTIIIFASCSVLLRVVIPSTDDFLQNVVGPCCSVGCDV